MLFRKFLRDIWKNKIQFISIFVMAALSTYIYAGMGSLYKGLDKELEEYYINTNFFDYMIYSIEGFDNGDLEKLRQNPGRAPAGGGAHRNLPHPPGPAQGPLFQEICLLQPTCLSSPRMPLALIACTSGAHMALGL